MADDYISLDELKKRAKTAPIRNKAKEVLERTGRGFKRGFAIIAPHAKGVATQVIGAAKQAYTHSNTEQAKATRIRVVKNVRRAENKYFNNSTPFPNYNDSAIRGPSFGNNKRSRR